MVKKLIITEIKSPDGYEISEPSVQYVTMNPDQDVFLTFINEKSPDFTIRKIDAQTGEALAGAVFSIEKIEEPNKGFVTGSPFTTDTNGEIKLPDLTHGSYRIVETKAPLGYQIETAERIITLKEGEDFEAVFENTKLPELTITKTEEFKDQSVLNRIHRFLYKFVEICGRIYQEIDKIVVANRGGHF